MAAHVLGFLGGSEAQNLSAMKETLVPSLGQEDALEKGMATHSSTMDRGACLQSMGSQSVGHD